MTFDNATIKVIQFFVTCSERQIAIAHRLGFTKTNNQHKAGVSGQIFLGIFNLKL